MAQKLYEPPGVAVKKKHLIHVAAFVVLAVLTLYVLGSQVEVFRKSFDALWQADIWLVLLALGLTLVTFPIAALSYMILSVDKHLGLWQTSLVQLAGAFINRLLPAGLGAIGLNTYFLKKKGYTLPAAGAILLLSHAIGLLSHGIMLTLVLAIFGFSIVSESGVRSELLTVLGVLAGLTIVALILRKHSIMDRFRDKVQQFWGTMKVFLGKGWLVVWAFLAAFALTMLNASVLWLCAAACGVVLSPAAAFMVFTAGIIGSTVTPTPGGVVGAEAALAGALIAAGAGTAPALAAALMFRFVIYWVPIVPGIGAFLVARRLKVI